MLELQTRIEAAQARPAAEQRVLDAMGKARISDNDCARFTYASEESIVCKAELARREGK